jgi:hypothetical protein
VSFRTRTRLVAAFASAAAFAQPGLAATNDTDSQAELIRQIAELRAEWGPTPASVVEPLRALALSYEEDGDYAEAIVALEEARYVTRVHNGLSSADEALLLRQQIRSAKALGDDRRVWNLEQDMLTIARQNHDDIRMVPVFRDLAEDRWDALEEYHAGGFPPEIELGCYYARGLRRYDDTRGHHRPPGHEGGCGSGQSSSVHGRLRAETLMYYADAIEVILESGAYASQELRDLERQSFRARLAFAGASVLQKKGDWVPISTVSPPSDAESLCSTARAEPERLDLLVSAEIVGSCLAPLLHANGLVEANVGGWATLVRLLAYEIRSGAPAATRANALCDLADYYLLSAPLDAHMNSEIAVALYERAYRELGQDEKARKSMFSPEVPVMFARNSFTSTGAARPSRYIDVSFAVTKHGHSEQIAIRESRGATRADERDLIRLIRNTRLRPRFVDGMLADSAPVVVRYDLDP